jgi:hypothetical protein
MRRHSWYLFIARLVECNERFQGATHSIFMLQHDICYALETLKQKNIIITCK